MHALSLVEFKKLSLVEFKMLFSTNKFSLHFNFELLLLLLLLLLFFSKYLLWSMLSGSGGKCKRSVWNLSSIQCHTWFVACCLGGIPQSSLESLTMSRIGISTFEHK